MLNKIIDITLILSIVLASSVTSYLVGHDIGYDLGIKTNIAEKILRGPGVCVRHNGAKWGNSCSKEGNN